MNIQDQVIRGSNIKQTSKSSALGFFFLCLYTLAVLVRPHEMFLASENWILIKIFVIISFLGLLTGQRPINILPQHYFLLALLPLIILSGFFNGSGMDGIAQAQKLFIGSIIPLFLYSNLITSIKKQHIIMVICLVAALLMVHNGYSQQVNYDLGYRTGQGWASSFSVGRALMRITYLGFFNDPNDLGMFLVMNIPFAVYFYTQGKFITKLTMLLALLALGYGIYMTGSRGTMVGAGALIIIYYLIVNAGTKLIIITAFFSPVVVVAYTVLQSGRDDSSQQRLEAWYEGIHMLASNPIFGVGKGQFMELHGRVAHNSYIQMAAELGVPGYSFWGGALTFTVLVSYLILKDKTHHKEKSHETDEKSGMLTNELLLNKTLFFSMIAFLVTGFFISRNYTLLLYVFIGMTLASNIRIIKLDPYYLKYFNNQVAIRSMGICWFIIAVVYLALKIAL